MRLVAKAVLWLHSTLSAAGRSPASSRCTRATPGYEQKTSRQIPLVLLTPDSRPNMA